MARERADRLFKKPHSINRLTNSSEFLRCSLPPPTRGERATGEALRALLSRPFYPCESRQVDLWYLPARWRDTTEIWGFSALASAALAAHQKGLIMAAGGSPAGAVSNIRADAHPSFGGRIRCLSDAPLQTSHLPRKHPWTGEAACMLWADTKKDVTAQPGNTL